MDLDLSPRHVVCTRCRPCAGCVMAGPRPRHVGVEARYPPLSMVRSSLKYARCAAGRSRAQCPLRSRLLRWASSIPVFSEQVQPRMEAPLVQQPRLMIEKVLDFQTELGREARSCVSPCGMM